MGKCSNCGKEIQYNQFKWYRDKILCYECYDTRLERKKAKKTRAEAHMKEEDVSKTIEDYKPGLKGKVKDEPEPSKDEPKEESTKND